MYIVDRAGWRILVKRAVDTNGRWSHGVWWWWWWCIL